MKFDVRAAFRRGANKVGRLAGREGASKACSQEWVFHVQVVINTLFVQGSLRKCEAGIEEIQSTCQQD